MQRLHAVYYTQKILGPQILWELEKKKRNFAGDNETYNQLKDIIKSIEEILKNSDLNQQDALAFIGEHQTVESLQNYDYFVALSNKIARKYKKSPKWQKAMEENGHDAYLTFMAISYSSHFLDLIFFCDNCEAYFEKYYTDQ